MTLRPFILLPLLVLLACGGDENPDTTPAGTAEDAAEAAALGSDLDGATEEPGARATILPLGDSGVSGTVTFTPTDDGLQVSYSVDGLEPGAHGFHVHENGDCGAGADGTPGGAAGGHYAPEGSPHGAPDESADARHTGDFGNIQAGADGRAMGTFLDPVAALGGPNGIAGKALLIHGGADDLTSQPSGDAGARVACGVIELVRGE